MANDCSDSHTHRGKHAMQEMQNQQPTLKVAGNMQRRGEDRLECTVLIDRKEHRIRVKTYC